MRPARGALERGKIQPAPVTHVVVDGDAIRLVSAQAGVEELVDADGHRFRRRPITLTTGHGRIYCSIFTDHDGDVPAPIERAAALLAATQVLMGVTL